MAIRVVALASGRGTNFDAIATAAQQGVLTRVHLVGCLSNRSEAPVLQLAQSRGIPTRVIESRSFLTQGKLDRDLYETELEQAIADFKPDLICLAGYLLLLGPRILQRWPEKILNIHPSLLPSFPGLRAQRQALLYGVKWTGCTVHFVDNTLDGGPIIAQSVIEVRDNDTEESLSARLLPVEHATYVQALRRLSTENYRIEGRRVNWG